MKKAHDFKMLCGNPEFIQQTHFGSSVSTSIRIQRISHLEQTQTAHSLNHDIGVKIQFLARQHDLCSDYTSEEGKGATVELSKDPESLALGCGAAETLVWFTEKGEDNWRRVKDEDLTGKTISNLEEGKDYCFRYLAKDDNAHIAEITSEIIPQELFLVITAPIFSGDACSASNGKKAGTITYEIPRFKLNGAQDFTMNMSSNQTMSLSGTALASEDGCEMTGSKLLRIIAQYNDIKWYDDAEALISDESFDVVGSEPHIYAIYKNGSTSLIDNSLLTFSPALAEGKWAAEGAVTVTVTDKADLSLTVNVAAE